MFESGTEMDESRSHSASHLCAHTFMFLCQAALYHDIQYMYSNDRLFMFKCVHCSQGDADVLGSIVNLNRDVLNEGDGVA